MRAPLSAPRRLSFGPFEADLHSGELLKYGNKVRLQAQPFQLLVMLLERPGELVTREQICARLWPADTFVDFDRSLGTALNKIREVLNDSAAEPRFVETLPRRGYRFIAPVTVNRIQNRLPLPLCLPFPLCLLQQRERKPGPNFSYPPCRVKFGSGSSDRRPCRLEDDAPARKQTSKLAAIRHSIHRSSSPVESFKRSGSAIFRRRDDR